jgi:hypothetical protein
MNISKKTIAISVLLMVLCLSGGFIAGYIVSYPTAYKEGYNQALLTVANLLQQAGVTLDWKDQGNGQYLFTVRTAGGTSVQMTIAVNFALVWRDQYGNLKDTGRGAGTFTNFGKNWTVQQLTGIHNMVLGGNGQNTTGNGAAQYLGNGNTVSGLSAATQQLPGEYSNNGLNRTAAATTPPTYYATGVFYENETFTVTTASSTVAAWGLYAGPYSTDTSEVTTLIAYDTGPGVKNTLVGDTLAEGWTVTFS